MLLFGDAVGILAVLNLRVSDSIAMQGNHEICCESTDEATWFFLSSKLAQPALLTTATAIAIAAAGSQASANGPPTNWKADVSFALDP